MELGVNFPIDSYYKGCIIDAETLSNKSGWWTAVLLLKDPKSKAKFISLYKWQQVDGVWKKRTSWKFKSNQEFLVTFSAVQKFIKTLEA
jgi:hypothetical protein